MGKWAIVTGGNRGIGAAIVKKLFICGYRIVVVHKNSKERVENKEMIDCRFVLDLSSELDISELVEKILLMKKDRSFGFESFNVVVNNAGIASARSFTEVEWNEFVETIKVNTIAPWFLTKELFHCGLIAEHGSVVNISSVSGFEGFTGHVHYCASKHGLEAVKKVLAKELSKHNIRVNNVAPSPVYTDMFKRLDVQYSKMNGWNPGGDENQMLHKYRGKMLIKRFAKPEEIADAVMFVINNEYVTGITVPVAGGNILR